MHLKLIQSRRYTRKIFGIVSECIIIGGKTMNIYSGIIITQKTGLQEQRPDMDS